MRIFMPTIKLLSEDLINKIAAGEVIERPASVVKELIENSLDARATKITVEIKDSGQELIKVTDNGEGMEPEDAETSLVRHATSKIQDDEDLFAIKTLGFRGEALASIAAVSELTLTTKRIEALEGYTLTAEAGKIIRSGIIGSEPGTMIEVRHLFFNTPARKKFLKTDSVELGHIIEVVTRYALINPRVTFRLYHEGHELMNSPGVEDWRSNLASIYGLTLAKKMLEIRHTEAGVDTQGFISAPYDCRNDKSQQQLFVNRRWVRNNDVINAVYDAYHALLFVNKHPILVLNINLDPATIDVNIHPTKADIKFEQREKVYQAVYAAVKETLQKNNLIPIVDIDEREEQVTLESAEPAAVSTKTGASSHYAFDSSTQEVFRVQETVAVNYNDSEVSELYTDSTASAVLSEPELAAEALVQQKIPPLRLLGQIHKTFFVGETPEGLFLIDQHAAHERILYEEFMEQYLHKRVAVQRLLKGIIIESTPQEKIITLEHKYALEQLGLTLELFGQDAFIVTTVPSVFGRIQPAELVSEVVNKLQEGKNKIEEIQEVIITRMACRAAVMAGDMVTIPQMEEFLKQLNGTKAPYTCPHGRPTMFKITVDELERKFRRK